jgi:hypothetical protein
MLLEYGIYLREPVGKGRNKFSVIKVGKMYIIAFIIDIQISMWMRGWMNSLRK